VGVKTHPVVGPFQRKVATVIKEMKSQSVADAQMTAIELQHEIGFLLRLHQWSENSWQHRQLSALIDELDRALVRLTPEPKPTAYHQPKHIEPNYFIASVLGLSFISFLWLAAQGFLDPVSKKVIQKPFCKHSSDGTAKLCYGGLP